MKKSGIKILITLVCLAVLILGGKDILSAAVSTAYAIGDLTINWGVPSGNPIFVINNMAPGQIEQRVVQVTNNAPVLRPVAVRGIKTSESNNLSDALTIVILDGVTPIYGPKSLSQFFIDSGNINGIFLSNLNPSQTKSYTFKVTFNSSSGNQYQNSQVIFDLKIGISVEIPQECKNIQFSGDPIFGTEKNDKITGTPGNDLIFGLEGHDKIEGNSGDDCIVGGPGNDKLIGNNGNDVILGGDGDDSLKGNNGDDLLIGGNGNDHLDGENGDDTLIGNDGDDSLNGGNGNDHLEGGVGKDSLKGENGNDFLDGGAGIFDSGNGGPGTDTCTGLESQNGCEL